MEFAIVGGDARFVHLARLLRAAGRDAQMIGGADVLPDVPRAPVEALKKARFAVLNWPDGRWAIDALAPGMRAYCCGPKPPEVVRSDVKLIDLWSDERLLLENAWLTAEGAISAVMNASEAALRDCRCMVIGWGRIGRALSQQLTGLGAHVTVVSHSEGGRAAAERDGMQSVQLDRIERALPGQKVIFSTPPHCVLGEDALRYADADVLIVDLASPPYGVDVDAAKALGLHAWREPKLPGRYCPYSAGNALMNALLRAEKEERA